MSFNLFNDGVMASSPSFLPEEFSGFNEDGFGAVVESCFKTISSPQIKCYTQDHVSVNHEFERVNDGKVVFIPSTQNSSGEDQQPRSYGMIGFGTWENTENEFNNVKSYTTESTGAKVLFSNPIGDATETEHQQSSAPAGLVNDLQDSTLNRPDVNQFYRSIIKQNYDYIESKTNHDYGKTLIYPPESFPTYIDPYELREFGFASNDFDPADRKGNYTYSLNDSRVDLISPATINPTLNGNSTVPDSNSTPHALRTLHSEGIYNSSQLCRPRFTKGSKNRLKIQREFTYDGVLIENRLESGELLINVAKNEEPHNFQDMLSNKLLEPKANKEHSICWIRRDRYIRINLDPLENLYENVGYEFNPKFHISKPYEPQYIRFELDPTNGLPFNETRSGLCPYCPNLNFKNLKTSTYSQHLALTHGVYTDNYLTPNPLYYGVYIIKKTNTQRRTKAHEHERCGVVCPCCYAIVGTECSKTTATSKPLNNYMRHFKEFHRQSKDKSDPIKFFNKTNTLH